MKEFKGRVINAFDWKGEAIVSHQVVNTMTTYYMSAYKNAKSIVGGDEENPDLFGKVITGKALCLPHCTASTNTGLMIQTICAMKTNPAAYLFSDRIDEMAASGIVLALIWEESDIICIDNLGEEFLNSVNSGDTIEIKKDGTVIIKDKEQ